MKRSTILAAAAALLFAGCTEKTELAGAGATFPEPYYNASFSNFSTETGIPVSYGGIGSGGGMRSLADKTVDFAGTDELPKPEEAEGLVVIPSCRGAVVLAYNLPAVSGLNLTPEMITGIFMGDITNWNDSRIAALNPGITLPDLAVTPVYRSDGSGTTFNFSHYMCSVDTVWASALGEGKTINFTTGVASKGNPGVAGTVANTEGSIGYVGQEYAFSTGMSMARIYDGQGSFVEPTVKSIADDVYPITCTTYLALYQEQKYADRSQARARATVDLMLYMLRPDVQQKSGELFYAPLSEDVRLSALEQLKLVTYDGQPIIKE